MNCAPSEISGASAPFACYAAPRLRPELLHGEETRVWGDQAYQGQTEVIREVASQAQDGTHRAQPDQVHGAK
jgi:IS5 family transposase